MSNSFWDSLSTPFKMLVGLTAAETILTIMSDGNKSNSSEKNSSQNNERKNRLKNSELYRDPMKAFYHLSVENQHKVLKWAKEHNMTIEEVIRATIDK